MERQPPKVAPRKTGEFRGGTGRHVLRRWAYSSHADAAPADDLSQARSALAPTAVAWPRGGPDARRWWPLADGSRPATAQKFWRGFCYLAGLDRAIGKRWGLLADGAWRAMGDESGRNGRQALTMLSCRPGVVGSRPTGPVEPDRRPGLQAPGAEGNPSLVAVGADAASTSEGPLFLEPRHEAPYGINRLMTRLPRSGVLNAACAAVFGEAVDCAPPAYPHGLTARPLLAEVSARAPLPLWRGFRGKPRMPVAWGWRLTMGDGWADRGRSAVADCEGSG
ncbi:MAG: hypothetical protein M0Z53_14200 [Thermaerobacter sp.]|nr:hypothetical protein [Thermaerobacter sp.]